MKILWQSKLRQLSRGGRIYAWIILVPRPLSLVAQIAMFLTTSLLSLAAHAQGTVRFANIGDGLDQPIYLNDWSTKVPSTWFTAELLAGSSAANLTIVATTGFTAPGYFDGGVVTIPDIPGGSQAFLEIRVWATACGSFAAAEVMGLQNTFGFSSPFLVTVGGGGNPPATLSRFQGFSVGFPEPLQFYYTTNNNTIAITGCTGVHGDLTIPSTINGLPVTSIGGLTLCGGRYPLISVTIPDSVTNIEAFAFSGCTGLGKVDLGNGVVSIGAGAFSDCTSLTNVSIPASVRTIGGGAFEFTALTRVRIPDGVAGIGWGAFYQCTNLASVTLPHGLTNIAPCLLEGCTSLSDITIPNSVTNIGDYAFAHCTSLKGGYFEGNAPSLGSDPFSLDEGATVYYLPGTLGWSASFGARPTAFWVRPNPVILTSNPNFGPQPNGFGFIISWATNASVAVDATTNLANATWLSLGTNNLSGGWSHFSDPDWKNYSGRFYRVRMP